jgi:probable rRNA maturation factor
MIRVEAGASPEWDSRTDWPRLAARAAKAAVRASDHESIVASGLVFEVSVKFTTDDEVKALNAGYRSKENSTNVLSFPMVEPELLREIAGADKGEVLLGDVVLAHGVVTREAADRHIPVEDHAAHLVVHGTLHLLGYDHVDDEQSAEAMEALEREALASLSIADPYRVREAQR